MQMVETRFENGDMVKMRNDPEKTVGLIVGFKVIQGGAVDYLVVWSPVLSQWHCEYEIETANKLPAPYLESN